MSFLKAEWRKLALINYEVDPKILAPYIPAKTELDLHNGKCYVSLVGFMFVNTRMLGLKIPFHINFEEVNLRFYVKHKSEDEWKRGVVFIKEIVPRRAISLIANLIYKEHYETCRMRHNWESNQEELTVSYAWKKGKAWHSIQLIAENSQKPLDLNSDHAFITEHYWGYTRINDEQSFEYEVTHPVWNIYPVVQYQIDVDFEKVYGETFSFLNDLNPSSVMLAEGSEITVESAKRI